MKDFFARAVWFAALAAAVLVCFVSREVQRMSTFSLAFGYGDTPPSMWQLTRYAAHLDTPSSFDACINRLRQLDGAKQQWAFEHGISATNEAVVTWRDVAPYLRFGPSGRLWCPHGGSYTLGRLTDLPTCSIKAHHLPAPLN
jgi:hypothetical protein